MPDRHPRRATANGNLLSHAVRACKRARVKRQRTAKENDLRYCLRSVSNHHAAEEDDADDGPSAIRAELKESVEVTLHMGRESSIRRQCGSRRCRHLRHRLEWRPQNRMFRTRHLERSPISTFTHGGAACQSSRPVRAKPASASPKCASSASESTASTKRPRGCEAQAR